MQELQEKIKKYLEERGWDILQRPGAIAKSITIESAELLEVFQWEDLSVDKIKADEKILQNLKDELADVLIYATEMAISLDLDIKKIMQEKLEKQAKKYPADLVRGNKDEYLKIKEAYRRM